jgi:hypothetical protein
MNDEEGHVDGADTIDGPVLIDHDLLQGQKRPSQLAHIHDRGERRFQNQTFGLALLADLGRDASAQRLAVEHDVARRHAEPAQRVIGGHRVPNETFLGGTAGRPAEAAIVDDEDAIAVGDDCLDLAGAGGDVAAIAGEIQKRPFTLCGRTVPGDQLFTLRRLEDDLLDACEARFVRIDPLRIRYVKELAVEQPCHDAEQRKNHKKS